jgi:hypothetical protein
MVELTPIDIFNGICAIATFLIYLGTALTILYKHYKQHEKTFIYMSLALIFLGFTWLALSISFISVLVTGERIPFEIQVIISNGFPFALLFWLLVFTELFYQHKRKIILGLWVICITIIEILLFVFIVTDTSLIGSGSGSFYTNWGPLVTVRILLSMLVFSLTGVKFIHAAIKEDNPEIKLKTRLLTVGIVLLIVGGLLFSITGILLLTLLILLFSVIGFYGGLVFPNWIKKIFLKNK